MRQIPLGPHPPPSTWSRWVLALFLASFAILFAVGMGGAGFGAIHPVRLGAGGWIGVSFFGLCFLFVLLGIIMRAETYAAPEGIVHVQIWFGSLRRERIRPRSTFVALCRHTEAMWPENDTARRPENIETHRHAVDIRTQAGRPIALMRFTTKEPHPIFLTEHLQWIATFYDLPLEEKIPGT